MAGTSPADLPGRELRRGELIGYVLDGAAAEVRVIVPQSEIELVRHDTTGVSLRLASDPARSCRARCAGGADGDAGPAEPGAGHRRRRPDRSGPRTPSTSARWRSCSRWT